MRHMLIAGAIFLFFGVAWLPPLNADEANQMTTITFSEPVEIPGQVLPAGTYVFKVLTFSEPNIVQIFSKDRTKLYATILAVPDYRHKLTGKPVITFEERPAGSPEAIRAWSYPGLNYGHEFVYPKSRALELAKITKRPIPSMPDNLAANTKMPAKSIQEPEIQALRNAQLKAQEPSGEEVDVGKAFTTPHSCEGR